METRHYKKTLSRRRFLGLAAGAMALVGTGAAFGKAALLNPGRPAALALKDSPWVRNIWHDLDPHEVWDGHVHLAGIGDANSGIVLGEGLNSPCRHPWQYLQRQFYMNASCPERTCAASADEGFALRLEEQMRALPGGVKALLLAFDFFHDEKGLPVREKSAFYVPDAYACRLARANPERFAWAASIHPYRPDAVDRLHAAAAQGAKAVKWLPAAQNIDPASPRCKAFYAALARLRLPLLTHCGEESAVQGADMQRFGHPLRHPRDRGR